MDIKPSDLEVIKKAVEPLIGLPVWAVRRHAASILNLHIGKKLETADDQNLPPEWQGQGEWVFTTNASVWRLDGVEDVIGGSEDEESIVLAAAQRLVGTHIQSIQVFPPALEVHLTFTGQLTLKVFPIHTQKHRRWSVYAPDDTVMEVGPGNTYSFEITSDFKPQKG